MEMLQLRYFYESAKNESFAKTAEKYMVPTTSVSAAIKRLEGELGCKLFERTSNRVTLNQNGKRLQQSLCVAFAELDNAVDDLSRTMVDDREINMLVRAVRSTITDRVIEYNSRHPQTAFRTVFDFKENAFEGYDIIIDRKNDLYEGFESFELCSMRIRLKAASDSPLCKSKHTLRQLCSEAFISWPEKSNMHKILVESCRSAGFSPNIAVQINDKECYERLISSGVGIGLGREEGSAPAGQTYLDVSDFDERYTVYVYYRKNAYYGNIKHFLDFIRKA